MNEEEKHIDDLLKRLMEGKPLDSPSDGFIAKVMANIHQAAEVVPVKKVFFLNYKPFLTYFLLGCLGFLVLISSDIPYLNYFPGISYFTDTLWPYLVSVCTSGFFSSAQKYFSFAFIIFISAGLLILFDRLIQLRISSRGNLAR